MTTPASVTTRETVPPRSLRYSLIVAIITGVVVSAVLYFPDRDDAVGSVLGGILALVGVALGLAAVERARPLPARDWWARGRMAGAALGVGALLGLGNLLANFGLSMLHPLIHQEMVERWAKHSPWTIMVVANAMMEELGFRLVLMGGVAWLISRHVGDRRAVFHIALGISALLFGLAHLLRPLPVGGLVGTVHAIAVVVKSAAAGLLLGWVFWRWGLPYSIMCHSMVNTAHIMLAPMLF